jgi:hypothetical protein
LFDHSDDGRTVVRDKVKLSAAEMVTQIQAAAAILDTIQLPAAVATHAERPAADI